MFVGRPGSSNWSWTACRQTTLPCGRSLARWGDRHPSGGRGVGDGQRLVSARFPCHRQPVCQAGPPWGGGGGLGSAHRPHDRQLGLSLAASASSSLCHYTRHCTWHLPHIHLRDPESKRDSKHRGRRNLETLHAVIPQPLASGSTGPRGWVLDPEPAMQAWTQGGAAAAAADREDIGPGLCLQTSRQ